MLLSCCKDFVSVCVSEGRSKASFAELPFFDGQYLAFHSRLESCHGPQVSRVSIVAGLARIGPHTSRVSKVSGLKGIGSQRSRISDVSGLRRLDS